MGAISVYRGRTLIEVYGGSRSLFLSLIRYNSAAYCWISLKFGTQSDTSRPIHHTNVWGKRVKGQSQRVEKVRETLFATQIATKRSHNTKVHMRGRLPERASSWPHTGHLKKKQKENKIKSQHNAI